MQLARSPYSGKLLPLIICALLIAALPSFCDYSETSDPIRDGGGARPLGLGRAVTAVVNDVNSIFYNPAGLASIKSPQAMGMGYSKVFGTYNYIVGGAATPTPWGTVGFAFVGEGINDIPITETGTDASFATYNDNLMILSYADSLKRYDPDLANVYVGTNLKFFNKGTSGPIDFYAHGVNMDLGVKYMPYNWLTLAADKENIWQGNLVWNTDLNENYPSPLFLGTRIKDMHYGEAYSFDVELPSSPTVPTLYHVGTELPVGEQLTLRMGGDQALDATSNKVLWNFALGVGIVLSGFNFDYSYHTYYNSSDYGSHFISVSYAAPFENNIKAYAGTATGNKPVPGDTVVIQVATPYGESYVAAVATDGTVIPLKYDKKIDRWTGTWTVPAGMTTGATSFRIDLLDLEGNPDPVYTNELIIITPEQATQEAAQEKKKAEDEQKKAAKDKVWERILSDINSTRSRDQYVNGSDMMAVISVERKLMVAKVVKREGVLLVSDMVNMLYESEMDGSKRAFMKDYLAKAEVNRQATYNDLVDAVLDSGYFEIVAPQPVMVAQAPKVKNGVTEQGIIVTEAPVAQAPAPVAQAPAPVAQAPAPVAQAPAPVTPKALIIAEKPTTPPTGMGGPVKEEALPVPQKAEAPQVIAQAPVEAPITVREEEYASMVDKTFNIIENYIGIKGLRGKSAHRKDMAVIIAKRNGYSLHDMERSPFTDVDPSMPESKYIQACYENSVFSGYPDKTFRPDRVISSYEMLWMMSDSEKSSAGKAAIKKFTRVEGDFKAKFDLAVESSVKTGYIKP